MSYDTEHDFNWLFQALPPRGQIPGAPPQTLPHVVLDTIRPTLDALGFQRYSDDAVIDNINNAGTAVTTLNGPLTPPNVLRFVYAAEVRHEDPVATLHIWLEIGDANPTIANQCGIAPAIAVPQFAANTIVRPVVLRTDARLVGRAEPAPGAGTLLRLRAFFIDLPVSEYIPPV